VGAARLLITGQLEVVLPHEEAEALEKAKPVTPGGGVKLDSVKVESRHDAQVEQAMASWPATPMPACGLHHSDLSVD
jgi:hypothetical protein